MVPRNTAGKRRVAHARDLGDEHLHGDNGCGGGRPRARRAVWRERAGVGKVSAAPLLDTAGREPLSFPASTRDCCRLIHWRRVGGTQRRANCRLQNGHDRRGRGPAANCRAHWHGLARFLFVHGGHRRTSVIPAQLCARSTVAITFECVCRDGRRLR